MPKTRTKTQKSSAPAKKSPGFWQNEPLQRKIIIWTVVIIGIFLVYSYFNYGSPKGFLQAHTPFPGASSKSLSEPRNALLHTEASIESQIKSLSIQPISVSELTSTDECVKGQHNMPIAGATEDSYAYWCTLKAQRYFVYSQPMCEVNEALLRQGAFDGGSCDPNAESSNTIFTKARNTTFENPGSPEATLSLSNVDALKAGGRQSFVFAFPDECQNPLGRPLVYCQSKGDMSPVNVSALDPTAKSILVISMDDTYYQK